MIKKIIKKVIKLIFNIDAYHCGEDKYLLSSKENDDYHIRHIYYFLPHLELRRLFQDYEINLVLDVGANTGQFASYLRNVIGYEGKIISFEPIKDVFEELSENSSNDSQWQVYNLALGEQDGDQLINVSQLSTFSSFLESNEYSKGFGEMALIERQEKVLIKRLDSFLEKEVKDYSQFKIFLKMDTQGYDLKVFSGLGDVVHSVVAMQSEVSCVPIYQDMPDMTTSISCFQKAGFGIAALLPVSTEKSLRIIEYDCIMVKADPEKAKP